MTRLRPSPLQLVDTKGTPATSDDTKYAPYVITLNQVDARYYHQPV